MPTDVTVIDDPLVTVVAAGGGCREVARTQHTSPISSRERASKVPPQSRRQDSLLALVEAVGQLVDDRNVSGDLAGVSSGLTLGVIRRAS